VGEGGKFANLLTVGVGIAAGGLAYLFALRLLGVTEMAQIWQAVARKLFKSK
jgi:hypothetical protein